MNVGGIGGKASGECRSLGVLRMKVDSELVAAAKAAGGMDIAIEQYECAINAARKAELDLRSLVAPIEPKPT
jgi:hypothetical protein